MKNNVTQKQQFRCKAGSKDKTMKGGVGRFQQQLSLCGLFCTCGPLALWVPENHINGYAAVCMRETIWGQMYK